MLGATWAQQWEDSLWCTCLGIICDQPTHFKMLTSTLSQTHTRSCTGSLHHPHFWTSNTRLYLIQWAFIVVTATIAWNKKENRTLLWVPRPRNEKILNFYQQTLNVPKTMLSDKKKISPKKVLYCTSASQVFPTRTTHTILTQNYLLNHQCNHILKNTYTKVFHVWRSPQMPRFSKCLHLPYWYKTFLTVQDQVLSGKTETNVLNHQYGLPCIWGLCMLGRNGIL